MNIMRIFNLFSFLCIFDAEVWAGEQSVSVKLSEILHKLESRFPVPDRKVTHMAVLMRSYVATITSLEMHMYSLREFIIMNSRMELVETKIKISNMKLTKYGK